ncbi:hypothetical protein LTR67_008414 [Exophiala xenobiotica]
MVSSPPRSCTGRTHNLLEYGHQQVEEAQEASSSQKDWDEYVLLRSGGRNGKSPELTENVPAWIAITL